MTDYRFDSGLIKNWTKTSEGFIDFLAPIAREGYLDYADGKGGVRREYVSRAVLKDSAHTFIRKPVTNLHPIEPVTAKNAKKYAVGWTANGAALDDNGVLWLQGTVFDAETIDSIESGETKEISCGYQVKTVQRGDEWHQVKRLGNHVAAVPRGRAGPDVAFQIDKEDSAYWCFDAIDGTDLEIPEVKPPPSPPELREPQNPNTKENKKMKVVLDGIEIEVSTMDEARHVMATDSALKKSRSDADALQVKSDGLNDRLQAVTAEHAGATTQVTALTAKLDEANSRYDSLKLDYDEIAEGRADGVDVDIRADKLGEMIADRMGLWNQVLPFMRSDDPDFKPDYTLDPIGIMATAVKTANPHLADQLDGLDLKTDSAQGFIKGLFLALDATKTEQKTRTTVDGMFTNLYQGRAQVNTSVDSSRNDAKMEKIRKRYRDAHKDNDD